MGNKLMKLKEDMVSSSPFRRKSARDQANKENDATQEPQGNQEVPQGNQEASQGNQEAQPAETSAKTESQQPGKVSI